MTPEILWVLREHFPALLSLLLFRSAPFAAHLLSAAGVRWTVRVAAAGAVGTLVALTAWFGADAWKSQLWIPAVYAGMGLGAVLVHAVSPLIGRHLARAGAVLVLGCLVFVLAPAMLVPRAAAGFAVVLGWELALSAHSYAVDTTASGARPPLRQAAFFLLVDPTFVYRERVEPHARAALRAGALGRIARGAAMLVGRNAALLAVQAVPALRPIDLTDVSDAATYGHFLATQAVLALGLYCAHAGLASVQIGWMRVLGYRVPERYVRPLLARSPQDFWQRWNTWVGRWAQAYLFVPIGHAAVRRWRGGVGSKLGLLLAFAGVGFLHDLGAWALGLSQGGRGWSPGFTALFVLFGIIVLGWRAARRLVDALPGIGAHALQGPRNALAWAACAQLVCALSWIAVPLLRNNHLPRPLERFAAHLVSPTRSSR
jgi:hypothetical protein